MNKSQLLEQLDQAWPDSTKTQHAFLKDQDQKNLFVQDLISALTHPQESFSIYTHSELDQKLTLVQKRKPREILASVFKAWGSGLIPILLDPELSGPQVQDLVETWGLYPLKSFNPDDEDKELFLAMATSGSSGPSKLIGLGAQQMSQSCFMLKSFLGSRFPKSWGLSLPCWHIGGFMLLWRMLCTGGQVYELNLKNSKWSHASPQLQAISLVPTQLQRLISRGQTEMLAKLSLILIGGAACPVPLTQKSKEHGLQVYLSYGSTETCSAVALSSITKNDTPTLLSPLPGVVFQNQGDDVLEVSSPSLHSWRIENRKLTHQNSQSFFQTQDKAHLKKSGELEILGRTDAVFISGGENISTQRVEKIASQYPLVQEVMLLKRKDPEFGHVGHLYYRASGQVALDFEFHFFNYLKENLRGFERPKSLEVMPSYSSLKAPRHSWQKKIEHQSLAYEKRPTLFLLHGFMGVPEEFFDMKQALVSKGLPAWKIEMLTLPGHGHNQILDETSTQTIQHNHAKTLRKKLGQDHILYGYSMGARVLSTWLHLNPVETHIPLKGLILESAHPGGLNLEESKQRAHQDALLFDPQSVHFKSFLEKWSKLPLFEGLSKSPRSQELIEIKSKRHNPTQIYRALQAFSVSHQPNVTKTWQFLAKTKPLYYLSGNKDHKYTKIGEKLAENSSIKHCLHPWASHNIHILDPNWCADKILEAYNRA